MHFCYYIQKILGKKKRKCYVFFRDHSQPIISENIVLPKGIRCFIIANIILLDNADNIKIDCKVGILENIINNS